MTQLNKKEERNKKFDEFNKQRRRMLNRNFIIMLGMITNFFLLMIPISFFLGKTLIATILNLVVTLCLSKIIFSNKNNKIKYKIFMSSFIFTAFLLIPSVWSDITPIIVIFIWAIISFVITRKLYEKL